MLGQTNGRGYMKKLYVSLGVIVSLVVVLLTALPTILHAAGLHPIYEGPAIALPGKRALIITTSHNVLAKPGETEGPETCLLYTSDAADE